MASGNKILTEFLTRRNLLSAQTLHAVQPGRPLSEFTLKDYNILITTASSSARSRELLSHALEVIPDHIPKEHILKVMAFTGGEEVLDPLASKLIFEQGVIARALIIAKYVEANNLKMVRFIYHLQGKDEFLAAGANMIRALVRNRAPNLELLKLLWEEVGLAEQTTDTAAVIFGKFRGTDLETVKYVMEKAGGRNHGEYLLNAVLDRQLDTVKYIHETTGVHLGYQPIAARSSEEGRRRLRESGEQEAFYRYLIQNCIFRCKRPIFTLMAEDGCPELIRLFNACGMPFPESRYRMPSGFLNVRGAKRDTVRFFVEELGIQLDWHEFWSEYFPEEEVVDEYVVQMSKQPGFIQNAVAAMKRYTGLFGTYLLKYEALARHGVQVTEKTVGPLRRSFRRGEVDVLLERCQAHYESYISAKRQERRAPW